METIKITPQLFKEQRLASGLTQQSMAKKAGVTQAVISRLEREPNRAVERVIRVLATYGLEVIPKDERAYNAEDMEVYQSKIQYLETKIQYLETKVDIYRDLIKELTK